jgi:hypothetical protein
LTTVDVTGCDSIEDATFTETTHDVSVVLFRTSPRNLVCMAG